MTPVYLDHAASTPTDPRVVAAMAPYYGEIYGNPSSLHSFGRAAAKAVEQSKETIAHFIGATAEELYITGSGTESNNLAILGVAKANKNRGKHIITSVIEHPSIINTCKALGHDGYTVTYLPVNPDGQIDPQELERTITEQTILVTLGYGNSEIGTLQDLSAIAAVCHAHNVLLHIDACQSVAYLPINVSEMKIDLLTFNGSKMYGPKGVAVLFVKDGVSIFPIVYGGGQQKSLRSGTENVAGIVGLAKACEIAQAEQATYSKKITQLRDQLQASCQKISGVTVNCDAINRLPNHLSICLANRHDVNLVAEMDALGVAVSAGSACSATSIVDSHVLRAIGLTSQQAQSTLRITLGKDTTEADIVYAINIIKKVAH